MLGKVKEDALVRISRVAGQVNGVRRMIEEDRYCVEVLDQIAAVRSALDQLGVQVLTGHLESCVIGEGDGVRQHDLLEEVRTSLSRFLK